MMPVGHVMAAPPVRLHKKMAFSIDAIVGKSRSPSPTHLPSHSPGSLSPATPTSGRSVNVSRRSPSRPPSPPQTRPSFHSTPLPLPLLPPAPRRSPSRSRSPLRTSSSSPPEQRLVQPRPRYGAVDVKGMTPLPPTTPPMKTPMRASPTRIDGAGLANGAGRAPLSPPLLPPQLLPASLRSSAPCFFPSLPPCFPSSLPSSLLSDPALASYLAAAAAAAAASAAATNPTGAAHSSLSPGGVELAERTPQTMSPASLHSAAFAQLHLLGSNLTQGSHSLPGFSPHHLPSIPTQPVPLKISPSINPAPHLPHPTPLLPPFASPGLGPHGLTGPHPPPPPPPHGPLPGSIYPWILARHGRLPTGFRLPDGTPFLLPAFRKPKRIRTAFSPSQLLRLEQAFEKNHYVVGAERKQLASTLQLTETQVKVWFQNRRTKYKRIKSEEDDDDDDGQGANSPRDRESDSPIDLEDLEDEDDEDDVVVNDDEPMVTTPFLSARTPPQAPDYGALSFGVASAPPPIAEAQDLSKSTERRRPFANEDSTKAQGIQPIRDETMIDGRCVRPMRDARTSQSSDFGLIGDDLRPGGESKLAGDPQRRILNLTHFGNQCQ